LGIPGRAPQASGNYPEHDAADTEDTTGGQEVVQGYTHRRELDMKLILIQAVDEPREGSVTLMVGTKPITLDPSKTYILKDGKCYVATDNAVASVFAELGSYHVLAGRFVPLPKYFGQLVDLLPEVK
jgi:hypothetical protein